MEENKYYTPEIEEFFVGFEYEVYDKLHGVWNKENNFFLQQGDFKDSIRVKHLDREDIESLGWEHDQTTKDGAVFYIGTLMDEKQWMLTAENARKTHDYTKIHICNVNNTLDDYFSGRVKNKFRFVKR